MKSNNQQQTSEANALASCYQLLLDARVKRQAANKQQAKNSKPAKKK